MRKLIVVGSSGHAQVVIDMVERLTGYQIVGLIDDFKRIGERVNGYEILGAIKDLPNIVSQVKVAHCVLAIGDNWGRSVVAQKISDLVPEMTFPSIVHPAAVISGSALIGAGTVVMAGAIVGPHCRIGEHCIVNTAATADHGCVLENFSSLGPGAVLGGDVMIGSLTAIGLGASVIQKRRIGASTVVGAAALVTRDLPEKVVAFGIPARIVRARVEDESYL